MGIMKRGNLCLPSNSTGVHTGTLANKNVYFLFLPLTFLAQGLLNLYTWYVLDWYPIILNPIYKLYSGHLIAWFHPIC